MPELSESSDCVGNCLIQWVKRAQGMHTPTWTEHAQSTIEALQEYRRCRAEMMRMIRWTQACWLDHDLEGIKNGLTVLERMVQDQFAQPQ